MTDEILMQRCIELAQMAEGETYPNPMVGAVIVHDGKIIGEGYHHKAGEPHAEINAIKAVKNPELLSHATIYVSLEPCSHFGKTPPCANKIIELGFKKVVIGVLDPNEKVNGRGKKIIEEAGIEVVSGVLEKECAALNKRFFTFHQKKRPYILLKWAESADGFLDKNFQPVQIGNPLTQQFVHQLRKEEHAIMVGTTTAQRDNPSLTTRAVFGRNPIRIVIDFDLKLPTNAALFNSSAETYIVNQIKEETISNLHYLKIEKKNFLDQLFLRLYHLKIQSVLVEGGAYTLQQFLDSKLWDEAMIIKNKDLHLQNGTKAPNIHLIPNTTEDFAGQEVMYYKNPVA